MKQNQDREAFVQMKNEDRYFGEKTKKVRRVDNGKLNKHRVNYRQFNRQDFEAMQED